MKLIALDLHQDNIVCATLDCTQAVSRIKNAKYCLQNDELERFLQTLQPEDIVILESTTNAFWMHRQIQPRVKKCYVLNTNQVHLRGNKTDTIDAKKLLQILSTFVFTHTESDLPDVYVPSESLMQLRSLFATYALLTKMSTQCKNRIHSLYRQNGVVILKSQLADADFRRNLLVNYPMSWFWSTQVTILLEQLEITHEKLLRIKEDILRHGLEMFAKEVKLLITIPGMSPFTAIAFMSDVGEIARFKSAKKLCAYLKTAPSIKSSNTTSHLGPVSKAGRSLTVTLLTQSIPHLKTASPAYSAFYQRLRAGKSAGKCRIALIRKTITSAYFMLKNGKPFFGSDSEKMEKKQKKLTSLLVGPGEQKGRKIKKSA